MHLSKKLAIKHLEFKIFKIDNKNYSIETRVITIWAAGCGCYCVLLEGGESWLGLGSI